MASELTVKSRTDVRADILRVLLNGARRRGFSNVNVAQGSDYWLIADAVAAEIEPLYAGIVTAADRFMPDTSTGDDLERWLQLLFREGYRPSGPSSGDVTYESTAATLITAGTQLLDPNTGAIYEVATGNTYDDGDEIPIRSRASGTNTNLDGGTVLKWLAPPPFASPTVTVTSAGLTGGVDEEDEETARERLLERLGDPPNGSNASSVSTWAEQGDSAVQRAFVYPAANGPSTVHVACAGYAESSATRSRAISATSLANARANVVANVPEYVESVVTTVVDSNADISFLIQIPSSVNAIPAGTGGGWVDGTPFPQPYSTSPCSVSSVTNSTSFQIDQLSAEPTAGDEYQVCYLSYSGTDAFTLYTATATVVSTSGAGPWSAVVSLDTPFVGIASGDYVWPACDRAQAYVDAVLDTFARLGPGEKTDQSGLLPYAYRRPRYFESWDYRLGGNFTRALVDAGDEVLDVEWHYQNGGTTSPALPAAITDGPEVFVPRRIAFYPSV